MAKISDTFFGVKKTIEIGSEKVHLNVKKMTTGMQMRLLEKYPNMGDATHTDAINGGVELVFDSISSWTFEDELTKENLLQLPSDAFAKISEAVFDQKIEKKN